MMDDRRSTFRRNAFTFGAVLLPDREIGCLVWDATAIGAQIEVEEPQAVPARFSLRLSEGGPVRPAAVAWRRDLRLGVTFPG